MQTNNIRVPDTLHYKYLPLNLHDRMNHYEKHIRLARKIPCTDGSKILVGLDYKSLEFI